MVSGAQQTSKMNFSRTVAITRVALISSLRYEALTQGGIAAFLMVGI